jgi:hypothetical protein
MRVAVPVVQVRIVRVLVDHRLVSMQVHVWFANRVSGRMFVLMVFVVDMAMRMLERAVDVFVFMPLREMKIETDAHQERGSDQLNRHRLAEQGDCQHSADKGGRREIGACSG